MPIKAVVVLCLATALLGGCVSVIERNEGNDIDFAKVASIEAGKTTLAEALDRLGAPLVYERYPDGLLVVYRTRRYRYTRFGFEPARMLTVVPAVRVAASALKNFSLVIQDGEEREERVAVFFGNDDIVAAVGVTGKPEGSQETKAQ